MNKRNTQQRRRTIVEMVNEQKEVSVEQLAKFFSTSEVTIRKDLAELENNGLILRRFGGAVPVPQEFIKQQPQEKLSTRKISLGKTAADLIKDHNRIIIDSGTTTASLIPELAEKQGLVVMTNSLNVANSLRELEQEPTILMTGGTWDANSESFQGKLAEEVLRAYNFDQLFIGADGLDIERGTTTYNELFNLSQVMADVAREVIVMMESEKIGRRIHNLELPWSCIDILITDSGISSQLKQQIEQQNIRVICAE